LLQPRKKNKKAMAATVAFFGAPLQLENKKEGDGNCCHLLWFVVAKKKKQEGNGNYRRLLWCTAATRK
jgi:hypothetical protein